jgi:hypothetical protein
MGGTADAGVVVTHGLLGPPGELVVGQVKPGLCHPSQVRFDGELVLGRGWHDPGLADEALGIDIVNMEEQATWGFGGASPD